MPFLHNRLCPLVLPDRLFAVPLDTVFILVDGREASCFFFCLLPLFGVVAASSSVVEELPLFSVFLSYFERIGFFSPFRFELAPPVPRVGAPPAEPLPSRPKPFYPLFFTPPKATA